MSTAPVPFEIRVRVGAAEIDGQGHVNNIVYLRWAQEVAIAHWQALAPGSAQAEVGWVARRHEIDYFAPSFLDDELCVRTWVGKLEGLSFERHTEILRTGEEKPLARLRTIWIPIHPQTGRPRRVSAEVRAIFARAGGHAD